MYWFTHYVSLCCRAQLWQLQSGSRLRWWIRLRSGEHKRNHWLPWQHVPGHQVVRLQPARLGHPQKRKSQRFVSVCFTADLIGRILLKTFCKLFAMNSFLKFKRMKHKNYIISSQSDRIVPKKQNLCWPRFINVTKFLLKSVMTGNLF